MLFFLFLSLFFWVSHSLPDLSKQIATSSSSVSTGNPFLHCAPHLIVDLRSARGFLTLEAERGAPKRHFYRTIQTVIVCSFLTDTHSHLSFTAVLSFFLLYWSFHQLKFFTFFIPFIFWTLHISQHETNVIATYPPLQARGNDNLVDEAFCHASDRPCGVDGIGHSQHPLPLSVPPRCFQKWHAKNENHVVRS